MVYCETCGQENGDQAKFCRFCGALIGTTNSVVERRTTPSRTSESIGFGSRNTGDHLVIRCGLCGSQDFAKDTGRLDSKWGFTSFKVVMCTCRRCGHIELFNKGRSIFDFD